VEIRDPNVTIGINAAKIQDIFGEYIDAQTHNLADRLRIAKEQQLDVLLDVEVTEYSHSHGGVKMTLAWILYDVPSFKQIVNDQSQASAPNSVIIRLTDLKNGMIDNQKICGHVVQECVEKMIKSINLHLSDNNAYEIKEK
jgi:GGDEF domain-containing protein